MPVRGTDNRRACPGSRKAEGPGHDRADYSHRATRARFICTVEYCSGRVEGTFSRSNGCHPAIRASGQKCPIERSELTFGKHSCTMEPRLRRVTLQSLSFFNNLKR